APRIAALFHDRAHAEPLLACLRRPECEDVGLKNLTTTARLVWQPRGYDPHLHKWLHRIDVPVLLVWGAHDRLLPAGYAAPRRKHVPHAELLVIPDFRRLPPCD